MSLFVLFNASVLAFYFDINIADLIFLIGEFSLRIFIVQLFGFIVCTSFCLLFITSCFTSFPLLTFADLMILLLFILF